MVLETLHRSLRQWTREPLYYFGSALTLALAIGAAVASLAVIRPALLDPLPYRDGRELISLLTYSQGATSAVSPRVLRDLEAAPSPLREFAAIRPSASIWEGAGLTESLPASVVTASYFPLLGARPAHGRFFADGETSSAVISWAFWQNSLGGDPKVVGRVLRLDGQDVTVVGVMAPDFFGPYWPGVSLWLPLDVPSFLRDPARGRRAFTVLARRTAPQGEVDEFLKVFTARMRADHPAVHGQQSWVARPLRDELVGSAGPALLGTGAAALLLLLTVTANLAGLSAVRAVERRRQIAVRSALGATRGRLRFDSLVDSLGIAVVGSGLGVAIGGGAIGVLAGFQRQFLDRIPPIELDGLTATLGVVAGLLAGLATALLPPWNSGAPSGLDALRTSRGSAGDASATRMRSGLVVSQVAMAFVLIVAAGLLARTVRHLSATDLGFESAGRSTFGVALSARYDTEEKQIQFERDALAELRRIPGVKAAHASVGVPVIGGMGAALRLHGAPADSAFSEVAYMSVAPGFMEGIGAVLKSGRHLSEADHGGAPKVAVINETMARTYWPAGNALGARVQIGSGSPDMEWITVVGIVADLRQHGPTMAVRPSAFCSTLQYSFRRRNFVLETGSLPATLAVNVRDAIRRVDSGLAPSRLQPFDELLADRTARHRLVMLALSGFGAIALVLSAFGLYAVVALTSRLRRREYAIRVALGAEGRRVRALVLNQGLQLGALGVAAGMALAVAFTRGLQGLLHGVEPLDQGTLVLAAAAVLGLAALSVLGPALRASRVDPSEALKAE